MNVSHSHPVLQTDVIVHPGVLGGSDPDIYTALRRRGMHAADAQIIV